MRDEEYGNDLNLHKINNFFFKEGVSIPSIKEEMKQIGRIELSGIIMGKPFDSKS